jgi:hypothetical protein
MRHLYFALSLSLLAGAPAAYACDMHGNADENFFLAYIDFRGMTEEQQRQVEQQAIDKYHAQMLTAAKTQFLSRFKSGDDAPEAPDTERTAKKVDETSQTASANQVDKKRY